MSERKTAVRAWHTIVRDSRYALALAIIALVAAALFTHVRPFDSAEVRFTDASTHGLAIVPASCPSTPDYTGQCDVAPPVCNLLGDFLNFFGTNYCSPPPPPGICPNGAPMSSTGVCPDRRGNCPDGYTAVAGQCVFTACPTGFTLVDNECLYSGCPSGFTLVGSTCVFSCPSGYQMQGTECVKSTSCSAAYVCSGNDLYSQDASCNVALVQSCTYGCGGGACLPTPRPFIATWNVLPVLLRSGDTATITWTGKNVNGCTITGSNGDSWSGTSGTKTTSPIIAQTTYTIVCQGFAGATPASVTRTTIVNIVPEFEER